MSTAEIETVEALWVGYPGETIDRGTLVPGESVRKVPRQEAEASDNWQIVDPDKPFPGYDAQDAAAIIDRLAGATETVAQATLAYEAAHKQRKTILEAAQARIDELATADGEA